MAIPAPEKEREREDKRTSEGGVQCFPHICRAKQGPFREGGGSSTGLKHLKSRMLIVSCVQRNISLGQTVRFLIFPFWIIFVFCLNMAASQSTSTMWRNAEWKGFTCSSGRCKGELDRELYACTIFYIYIIVEHQEPDTSVKDHAVLLMTETLGQWFWRFQRLPFTG